MSVSRVLSLALRYSLKDPRLIFANIRERIVFDLLNRVDTIQQIAKDAYAEPLANIDHGLHYSSSWTSEIRFGFQSALRFLANRFEDFTFVDVGCGKGKVQIYWTKALARRKLRQEVYGLDYYEHVLAIARSNFSRVFGRDGHFIRADAAEYDLGDLSRRLILYLYNPFDAAIIEAMLKKLDQCEVLLIYNNPEQAGSVERHGFRVIEEKRGFHPQATTFVYYKPMGVSDLE